MKYMFLVYQDEAKLEAMPDGEWNTLIEDHLAYDESLRKSGHWIAAKPLESSQTATTLRVRNGKVSITDGPFAETKEQFAGFFLIEARDVDDAIQAAAKVPSAKYGTIEVRPVRELGDMKRGAG